MHQNEIRLSIGQIDGIEIWVSRPKMIGEAGFDNPKEMECDTGAWM
jgi:hypothetical protein